MAVEEPEGLAGDLGENTAVTVSCQRQQHIRGVGSERFHKRFRSTQGQMGQLTHFFTLGLGLQLGELAHTLLDISLPVK